MYKTYIFSLMSTTPQPVAGSASAQAVISREDLITSLNELLEAERAGARVSRETVSQMPAGQGATLVHDIHRDEVHWCSLLLRLLRGMQAQPSDQTGAFYGKAMAIADLQERLMFLNKGQSWVVRRLQQLIPRIADVQMQADLRDMLQAHEGKISQVESQLRTGL